jgi:murein DD-endopeptidase MepM/ murein hydrolase activator NlpD
MKQLLPVLMGFALLLLSSTEGWSGDFQTELDANSETTRVSNYFTFQQSPILIAERRKGKRRGMRGKKKRMRMFRAEPCANCEGLEGFVPPNEVDDKIRKMVGKYRGGSGEENVAIQQARGVIKTGLYPKFISGARCPEIDSEKWAIDYSHKRGRVALHRGVDIPQPRGTPIRAVASGVVIGRFKNEGRKDGIAVILRHTPEQTGLKYWTYSQYTHLQVMSPLPIGANVKMGAEVGKTGNTGKMGRKIRRDAVHFAIFYSVHPEWSNDGSVVTPKDGYFMDPNAFYRRLPPYDSESMLKLPDDQKAVPVPYMKSDGSFVPTETKRIWPYPCE